MKNSVKSQSEKIQTATIPTFSPSELMKISHSAYIKARNSWLEQANAPALELKAAIDYIRFAQFGHNLCALSKLFPCLLQESDTIKKHAQALELSTKIICKKDDFVFFRDSLVKLLESVLHSRVVYERDFIKHAVNDRFSVLGDNVKNLGGI